MTALEEIKKALEGVTHVWGDVNKPVLVRGVTWIAHANYDDRQAQDNAIYLKAVNPSAISAIISEIDRLQRENEALKRDRYDLAYAITGGEDAPGLLDTVSTTELIDIARDNHRSHSADIDRAEAAEAEVKLIREAVGELLDQAEHVCLGAHTPLDIKEAARNLADPIAKVRTALASTGGEHNGN